MEVNYLAILVASIAAMAIGMTWYHPKVFGAMWMKLVGMTEEKMAQGKKDMPKATLIALLAKCVVAWVAVWFLGAASMYMTAMGNEPSSMLSLGLQTGFWLWLGFTAPFALDKVLWEKRPTKLWVLNQAHNLVSLMVMCAILASW